MRVHVLGIPHTVSTLEYSSCAFTQKVVKLCKMLYGRGHHVIHYGHKDSKVECTEHVTVTTGADLRAAYGNHNWRLKGFPNFRIDDKAYRAFYKRVIPAIAQKKQPGDFLMCAFGKAHAPIAASHPDLIPVESGIGYATGTFSNFRIFESYAIMHAYMGVEAANLPRNTFWYDNVIPNAFDLDEFTYNEKGGGDYLLFLGRVTPGKGVSIVGQIARELKVRVIAAGAGDKKLFGKGVEYVGIASPGKRAKLLAGARATLCPSTFMEPFCGVQIESMISGTPVISSDWGAFAELNQHGKTGFRCHTFEQFLWAVQNIDKINRADCRAQGVRFSLERVAPFYDEYLDTVNTVWKKEKGWYTLQPDRKNLWNTSFNGMG